MQTPRWPSAHAPRQLCAVPCASACQEIVPSDLSLLFARGAWKETTGANKRQRLQQNQVPPYLFSRPLAPGCSLQIVLAPCSPRARPPRARTPLTPDLIKQDLSPTQGSPPLQPVRQGSTRGAGRSVGGQAAGASSGGRARERRGARCGSMSFVFVFCFSLSCDLAVWADFGSRVQVRSPHSPLLFVSSPNRRARQRLRP